MIIAPFVHKAGRTTLSTAASTLARASFRQIPVASYLADRLNIILAPFNAYL
jgi:hypothetical protein